MLKLEVLRFLRPSQVLGSLAPVASLFNTLVTSTYPPWLETQRLTSVVMAQLVRQKLKILECKAHPAILALVVRAWLPPSPWRTRDKNLKDCVDERIGSIRTALLETQSCSEQELQLINLEEVLCRWCSTPARSKTLFPWLQIDSILVVNKVKKMNFDPRCLEMDIRDLITDPAAIKLFSAALSSPS